MSTALKISIVVMLLMIAPAWAVPTTVFVEDTPDQDPLMLPPNVHELGDIPPVGPFPIIEGLVSTFTYTDYVPCPVDWDPFGPPNVLVSITNMSPIAWRDLHYVGDAGFDGMGGIVLETSLTNDDGLINGGLAFRIDYFGLNTPLLFESLIPDTIFQPGETWEFVIQNYANIFGGPPTPFDSIGVGVFSTMWPPSTGSIVAIIPEPATLAVLLLGAFLGLSRRVR